MMRTIRLILPCQRTTQSRLSCSPCRLPRNRRHRLPATWAPTRSRLPSATERPRRFPWRSSSRPDVPNGLHSSLDSPLGPNLDPYLPPCLPDVRVGHPPHLPLPQTFGPLQFLELLEQFGGDFRYGLSLVLLLRRCSCHESLLAASLVHPSIAITSS